jgi:hypothetical protein
MLKPRESEKTLERRLTKIVEKDLGGLCIKLTSVNRRGLPDRLVILPKGTISFWEIKSSDGRLSKLQVYFIRSLRSLGVTAYVIASEQELKNSIRQEVVKCK